LSANQSPDWLSEALGAPWVRVLGGDRKYFVELEAEADALRVQPDFGMIRRFCLESAQIPKNEGIGHD
jgi:hypothetical protein